MGKYEIRLRRKNPSGSTGKIMGRMGDYSTQKAAKEDAQTIADTRTFAPDVQITVEPKRRKNSAVSRGRALAQSAAIAQRTGRLYNPKRAKYKVGDHVKVPQEHGYTGKVVRIVGKSPYHYYVVRFGSGSHLQVTEDEVKPPPWARNPRQRKPKRNGSRMVMGHTVTGTTGNYKIQPYGKRCKTLADVRSWLKAHIQRERRR